MVTNEFDRELATDSFEYGNHEIGVEIRVLNTRIQYADTCLNNSGMYEVFVRKVDVTATKDGVSEITKTTYVNLEDYKKLTFPEWVVSLFPWRSADEILAQKPPAVPSLADQIEETVRPVLSELDKSYKFVHKDVEVDVEAGMERVRHEMSWTEVEDELDRISSEIDSMTEEPAD